MTQQRFSGTCYAHLNILYDLIFLQIVGNTIKKSANASDSVWGSDLGIDPNYVFVETKITIIIGKHKCMHA